MRRTYRGRDVEVSFDLDVCIHVGARLAGAPGVFELHRRPWIQPDADDADAVADVVQRCPSGALQYRRLDGEPQETPPDPGDRDSVAQRSAAGARHDRGQSCRRDDRGAATSDAVPVRSVEEQAVLRQQPPRRRVQGRRRADQGSGLAGATRPGPSDRPSGGSAPD